MNVLLVTMPWEKNTLTQPAIDDESHYPLGLAYIHSYLESKGHEVRTLWLNNYTSSDALIEVDHECIHNKPDIVGFNILSFNRVETYNAIEWINSHHPSVKIVLGGIHTTIMYNQLLQKFPYVTVVLGEGEVTMGEICEGKGNAEIKGIAYSVNGKVFKNEAREPVDLDTLPFPKHELFFQGDRKHACIITSRGCGFRCSFCCLNPDAHKTRFLSIGMVMAEIQYLIESFPKLETIWIHDDNFLINNQRAIIICNSIASVKSTWNRKIKFVCSGRAKPMSKELVTALEQAGFTTVLIGMESGDVEVLKRTHKGITLDDVTYAAELFRDSPIELYPFVIVGLPGETDETIQNAAKFIQGLQKRKYIYYVDCGVLAVYPGTEVYGKMKAAGKIDDGYWLTDKPVPLYTVDYSEEKLVAMRYELLNHIAIARIVTWEGFRNQWRLLPQSVPYVVRRLSKKVFGGN